MSHCWLAAETGRTVEEVKAMRIKRAIEISLRHNDAVSV
jgi:hypothetical protein